MARVLQGLEDSFADHAARCPDRVVGILISEGDFRDLEVAEIWGVPVLWEPGRESLSVKLICEADSILTPQLDTVEELQQYWRSRSAVR